VTPRSCRRCGKTFESDRDHHRYCWTCFWELRDDGAWQTPPSGWETPHAEPRAPAPVLDVRLLRDLVKLLSPRPTSGRAVGSL
jgi:hypothetical protein